MASPTASSPSEHAVLVAAAWPLALTAAFLPLSARAYRNLSR